MIRVGLALVGAGVVLALGVVTAWVQAGNYEVAARLDALQRQSEWNERRTSDLRAALERFEFEQEADENQRHGRRTEAVK